jgi:transposase
MPYQEVFGADVGRGSLAIARHEPSGLWTIPNSSAGIAQWLQGVAAPALIAVESTGRYHQDLAEQAHSAGHRVFVLDPRRLKAYRKALGVRAKTDRRDAELIAHYVAQEHATLHRFLPMSPSLALLTRLLRRRSRIVVCRQRLKATLRDSPECQEQLATVTAGLKALLQRIDAQCDEILNETPERRARRQRLRSIPGIGPLTSAALLAMLERIPYGTSDALVAATGLDPRPNDSGDRRGRRRLTKRGSAELRRLLYNAALAAARESEPFQRLYKGYRARGLNSTTALVAIARKLVRIAFALEKTQQTFDVGRLGLT